MKNIQITPAGIRKALKKYEYPRSITEYIWNGFDAEATQVDISFISNVIGTISELKIRDNGYGISDPTKFEPFFESDKEIDLNAARISSNVHGKNGVGRLTFFTFASLAKWETVYEEGKKKYKYTVEVSAFDLNKYIASDPVETLEATGTVVYFQNIHTITVDNFSTDIKEFLCREFGWFLELNLAKKLSLKINESEIDYENFLVGEREIFKYEVGKNVFKIKFIHWLKSLNREYSRYYLISSDGEEKYTNTTTLNNKGDGFFHSVFIESPFFDSGNVVLHETSLYKHTEEGKAYKKLMTFVDGLLRSKRKPFLKKASDDILENFEKSGAFPKFKSNSWDQ